ncbi:peptide chain release factor N(5)-glutamine methyltransferase [Eubacteriales bacterium KG127]
MTMPVKELLLLGEKRLVDAGLANGKNESRDLYCFRFGLSRRDFLMEWQKSREYDDCEAYFSLLDRRASGEPLQYIIGKQNFYGYDIHVEPGVLIPRLDSETVVEKALEVIRGNKYKTVLDLCTGSGALGIAIAKEAKGVKVTLSDKSPVAVKIAKKNVANQGLDKDCKVVEGNLFEPFKGMFGTQKFDVIISNPPYIPTGVISTLDVDVKNHEPMEALDGGEDGLDFYKKIISSAKNFLRKRGTIVFEIGHNQGESVSTLLREAGFSEVLVYQDMAGKDRTALGKL